MEYVWYVPNEDYPEVNDESQLTFEDGVVTAVCNDVTYKYAYEGTPHEPTPEALKKLQKDALDGSNVALLAADLLETFGVTLGVLLEERND